MTDNSIFTGGSEDSIYQEIARGHLVRCAKLLEECDMILDSLEGILDSSNKPSEHLGWR
ncbi:MAG: hypothetical protein PHR56_08810 [Dehalococcoidales bacterium]|nr:hypothetical protein [Dehalococcoidales bacterium]